MHLVIVRGAVRVSHGLLVVLELTWSIFDFRFSLRALTKEFLEGCLNVSGLLGSEWLYLNGNCSWLDRRFLRSLLLSLGWRLTLPRPCCGARTGPS